MIGKILLPLDGSPLAERAIPYAMRLASSAGARLILMHATVPPSGSDTAGFDVEAFARQLREAQAALPSAGANRVAIDTVTHHTFDDRVAEGICAAIAELGAELVVMATHADGGLGRWWQGGVADHLLCQSPVPVLLIPPTCEHTWADGGGLRILIPLDGSRFAEEALVAASELAAPAGGELVLVGATGAAERGYADGVPSGRSAVGTPLQETRDYLDEVAARLRTTGQTVAVDAEAGRPRTIIESIARRRRVDLIAMATHGRTGVARHALGSVATELLGASTVPVLLWRPAALRHAPASVSAPAAAR